MAEASEAGGFLDKAFEFLARIDYRLATDEIAKREIFALRYQAYLSEGAILPNPEQVLSDRFDDQPNSWLIGLYIDGVLSSSLRICVATPLMPDTPAVDAFPEFLEREVADGKTIVDPNRFVADLAIARAHPLLPYMTVRLAYMACSHFDADLGTATVRREHAAFYRRVFLHRLVCPPRPYPTLIKPLGLMTVDYHQMRDQVFRRYPFFHSTANERLRLFGGLHSMKKLRNNAVDTRVTAV